MNNNTLTKKKKQIDNNGNETEIAEDMFINQNQIGKAPITGDLITKNLVEKAEKILTNNKP